jgi:hypothetical protein
VSQAPEGVDKCELYVVCREVLLDGLTVLKDHAEALTVVGAQAVYLRTNDPSVQLTIPMYTADSDLSIDPNYLSDNPLIDEVLRAADFELAKKDNRTLPGQWYTGRRVGDQVYDIPMDLLVPQSVSGATSPRRWSVNLPPHDKLIARRVDGLEAALIDADPMEIASLLPLSNDTPRRVIRARVAGPAALLVAKAYKIAEREDNASQGRPNRLTDKDAGDVVRLMLGTEPDEVAARFETLLDNDRTATVTRNGLVELRRLFGGSRTTGTVMARSALAGDPIEHEVPGIVSAYLADLPSPAAIGS